MACLQAEKKSHSGSPAIEGGDGEEGEGEEGVDEEAEM
jgi:hypothetical protein